LPQNLEIESILKDFYNISGIRISIHDTEFNEIYSHPKEPSCFCRYMQTLPDIKKECSKSDRTAFEKVSQTKEVFVYKCKLGLYEAVVPLYSFGVCSGYLMMGQVCDTESFSKKAIEQKTEYALKDPQKAKELCKNIPTIDRALIDSYINIMRLLAEYLTSTNRAFSDNTELPKMIKEYISRNYSSKISLDTLSQKFGYCNATLTKSFKKAYGISIMTHLFNVRLEKAGELVTKSRYSFKQIANDCGFSDQNYFSKSFIKHFGCSPSEYRKKGTIA